MGLTGQRLSTTRAYVSNGWFWPRLCQNSKLPGFRVSLYPSRRAAKPIQSVLIGRLSRSMSKSHVLTQPYMDTARFAKSILM